MDHLLKRTVLALCEDIATPRSLTVKALIECEDWTQLLQLRTRPLDYLHAEDYFRDTIVTDLCRKMQDLSTNVDREGAAVQTFFACEAENHRTNLRLSRFLPRNLFLETPAENAIYEFICRWRKEVAKILGAVPSSLSPRFSGGSALGFTGYNITIPDKMSSAPTITPSARCLLPFWYETSWFRSLLNERPGETDAITTRSNKFFTVPKDAEKHRGCCMEPLLNVCFQLDAGRHLRDRLKRVGIDLEHGQDEHRKLAQLASIDDSLVTVDMSNASDTVSRVLVELLLPEDWFLLLDSLRSKSTLIKGQTVLLEKFSSMGNGFTFELETLIFVTLARTLADPSHRDLCKSYGDDLIVPKGLATDLISGLKFFGFTPNVKKTFIEGPFRESCGGDFFDGYPVRGHFLEESPDEPQKWISLANGLRRIASEDWDLYWPRIRRAWNLAVSSIPTNVRACRGPASLGDLVIHDHEEFWNVREIAPRFKKPWQDTLDMKIPMVRVYKPVTVTLPWRNWSPLTQLACCTLGVASSGVSPRSSRGNISYKVTWMPFMGRGRDDAYLDILTA